MEDKIRKIIKKELRAKILEIKTITEGYSHQNYLVKINKTPHEVILRFANNIEKKESLLKEKYVMGLLKKSGIPVPKIYAFHFQKENKKSGYMILEKINGLRLDTVWNELSNEEKILITKKMGKLLSDMHKITFKEFGMINEDGSIGEKEFTFKGRHTLTYNECLKTSLKTSMKDVAILGSFDDIPKKFMLKYTGWILDKREVMKYKGKPCFIHGDFFPGHVFIRKINDEWKIVGLIDVELAESFRPEADLIKLDRSGFFDIPYLRQAIFDGYGKKFDVDLIRFYRTRRDFSFARVIRTVNPELADKKLKEIENIIDKENNIKEMKFFKFP